MEFPARHISVHRYIVPCCRVPCSMFHLFQMAFFQSMGEGRLSICDNKVTFKLKMNLKQFS